MHAHYFGPTTPNSLMGGSYAREAEGFFLFPTNGKIVTTWCVYSHHSGGMIRSETPPNYPWHIALHRVEKDGLVEVARSQVYTPGDVVTDYPRDANGKLLPTEKVNRHYLGLDGTTKKNFYACAWTYDMNQLPTGQYYCTVNGKEPNDGSAHGFFVPWARAGEKIPVPQYVLQRPQYMPQSKEWPINGRYNIVEFKGTRNRPVPMHAPCLDGGKFDRPFKHDANNSELYSETIAFWNSEDYHAQSDLATTPMGGVFDMRVQRYSGGTRMMIDPNLMSHNIYAKEVAQLMMPMDNMPGDISSSGVGLACSGWDNGDGTWNALSPAGAVLKFTEATRTWEAIYGNWGIPGALMPQAIGLLKPGPERDAYVQQSIKFYGDGPPLSKAWQMCKRLDKPGFVLVVEPWANNVVEIELATGKGSVFSFDERYNQLRGICQIAEGPFKHKILVASEHGCEIFMLDPATGAATSLIKSTKIPTVFGKSEAENSFKTGSINGPIDPATGKPTVIDAMTRNRNAWCAQRKEQNFTDPDLMFAHPCQMAVGHDGKTVFFGTHDTFRLFKLDLESKKLTLWFNAPPRMGDRPDMLTRNWWTMHADNAGVFGHGPTLWISHWHYNSLQIVSQIDGTAVNFQHITNAAQGDCIGWEHDAYPEAMIVSGHTAKVMVSATGKSHMRMVRKRRPDDPTYNRALADKGHVIFRSEYDNKPSLQTILGSGAKNRYDQFATLEEMELMSEADWRAYMKDNFGCVFSEDDWVALRYFLRSLCPLSQMRIRFPGFAGTVPAGPVKPLEPVIVPPTMGFQEAVGMVGLGVSTKRAGGSPEITLADVKAVDWVVKGFLLNR